MTIESPLIGKFCGVEIPKLIPSFTNHLLIRFGSDNSIGDKGFQIEYEQTSTGCGGRLDSFEGSIHSPHYPETLSDSMKCDWYIIVNPGSTIDFSITGHSDLCKNDILVLYDDQDFNTPIKLNCSNNKISGKSKTNSVHVQYSTSEKSSEEIKPFLLEYKLNCNVIIDKPFGVIESPNFPGDYPPNLKCQWKIISPKSSTIKLSFSHLNLEFDPEWSSDYLQINDLNGDEEIKSTKLSSKPQNDITSSGNNVLIKFVSDFAIAKSGFRLEFTRQGCGGHLSSKSGEIITPDSPYSTNVDCEWFIEIDPGNVIVMMFRELHIDTDTNDCNSNALIVADDKDLKNVHFKECKTDKSDATVTSSGESLFLFHSQL